MTNLEKNIAYYYWDENSKKWIPSTKEKKGKIC